MISSRLNSGSSSRKTKKATTSAATTIRKTHRRLSGSLTLPLLGPDARAGVQRTGRERAREPPDSVAATSAARRRSGTARTRSGPSR